MKILDKYLTVYRVVYLADSDADEFNVEFDGTLVLSGLTVKAHGRCPQGNPLPAAGLPGLPGIYWVRITDSNWRDHGTFAIGKAIKDGNFFVGYDRNDDEKYIVADSDFLEGQEI